MGHFLINLRNKVFRNMKIRNAFLMTLVAAAALVAATCPKATPADKEAVMLQKMMEAVSMLHYSPQSLNDELSKKVYKVYIDRIDGGRRFLTQADVEKLQGFENQIDDQVKALSFDFFNTSVQLIDAGVVRAEAYYKEAIAAKHDFNIAESVELDGDKTPFAKDEAELKEMWRKTIKYNILTRYVDKVEAREEGKTDAKDKSDADLLAQATKETQKTYDDYFKRIKKVKRTDRLSIYLNSIVNVFDPHTEYFQPIEKQNFDIGMSGRLIGIGARLQIDLETDLTKVTEIVVGGPAWKQGELKDGDLIMKVAQGEKEPVDVAGMDLDEVVSMIRGQLNTEVRLTVKSKSDGKVKVVSIIREEVISDEGFAKSLILQDGAAGNRIGYIKLPKFYADFEREDGRDCSNDVAAEVEKLKAQGVKGIIIDLRNNGGGSLRDVVEMSGLFIEQGPIVQVKGRLERPDVLSDLDPSVQYAGPLVIMVNESSASASEIMAAALQDYGRAIIVGTPTYGKGTVQRFFDLDRFVNTNDIKPLGQTKITIQKFFRINGGSTQLKGVTPDIILPDTYMEIPTGEKDNEHPMAWTQISPVKYSQQVVDMKKLPEIVTLSKKRVEKSEAFRLIVEKAKQNKQQRDESIVNLNLAKYRESEKRTSELGKKFENMYKPIDGFTAENLPEDLKALNATQDSAKIIRNTEWLKGVKKDMHLYETLQIVRDLIQNATFKTAAVDKR